MKLTLPLGLGVLAVALCAPPAPADTLHVVVAGRADDPRTMRLWRAGVDADRAGKVVDLYDPASGDPATLPAAAAAMVRQAAREGRPSAYVCSATRCSLPETDPEALRRLIERFDLRP